MYTAYSRSTVHVSAASDRYRSAVVVAAAFAAADVCDSDRVAMRSD